MQGQGIVRSKHCKVKAVQGQGSARSRHCKAKAVQGQSTTKQSAGYGLLSAGQDLSRWLGPPLRSHAMKLYIKCHACCAMVQARQLVSEAYASTVALVEQKQDLIIAMADLLLEKEVRIAF